MIVMKALRFAALLAASCAATGAQAAKISVLFHFPARSIELNGAMPMAGLVAGPDGSLYGTTAEGGDSNCSCGTVFQLTSPTAGKTKWTQTVLHSFTGYPNDGQQPIANLMMDAQGNLYGTTQFGGPAQAGTIFMLKNGGGGSWAETVLHGFTGADGELPYASLTPDSSGNLYGTTSLGGSAGQGTLFKLQLAGANSVLTVLHNFAGGADGGQPYGGVIFDGAGDLYGTTSSDGATDLIGGSAFQYTPDGTATVLHTFTDIIDRCCRKNGKLLTLDGGLPSGNLTFDKAGNLYGTTIIGGSSADAGIAFMLSPPAAGKTAWTEKVLHTFVGNSNLNPKVDGATPTGSLVIDAAGNLYGATSQGGDFSFGTVYKLTLPAAGKKLWKEKLLLSFNEGDGNGPAGSLIADTQGNLYGTTVFGAAANRNLEQIGGVYRLAP